MPGISFKSEYRSIVLISLIAITVIVIGFVIYFRIAGFVDDVTVRMKPDQTTILLQQLKNDLVRAEKDVNSYTLTENVEWLDEYNNLRDSAEGRVVILREIARNGHPELKQAVEILNKQLEMKYNLMDTILFIQDNYRVNRAFSKIKEVINSQPAVTHTVVETPRQVVVDVPGEESKKENLLKRIFTKKAKDKAVEPPKAESPATKKSVSTVRSSGNTMLMKKFSRIEQEERLKEINMNEKLLSLEEKEVLVNRKINNTISLLEYRIRMEIEHLNALAKSEAKTTNLIVAIFIFTTVLLLIVTSYTIVNYIRQTVKTNQILRNSKQKSDELAASKTRFLSTMSHEIRTPMNAILGFSEQLSTAQLAENEKKQVKIIHDSAAYLVELINETLEISKLDAGKMTLVTKPFNLRELIESTASLLQPLVDEKQNQLTLVISPEVPQFITSDEYRLRQIILNLLGNAVKFTNRGEIKLNLSMKTKNGLLLAVSDSGIGMTDEQMNHIFDEYEQADNLIDRKFGGTGLGLPITKKLIGLFQGEIRVESRLGEGTVFYVEIPVSEAAQNQDVQTTIKSKTLEILRPDGESVLVVDDELYNRQLLEHILRKNQVTYELAETVDEALKLLETKSFTVVLTDINMPGKNGHDLLNEIRKSELTKNIRIVALTAHDDPDNSYLNAGFDGYIQKPFTENQLMMNLAEIMNNQQGNINAIEMDQPDKQYILDQFGNDEAFTREMIAIFVSSTEKGLEELHEITATNQFGKVKDIAHRIAPPFKQMNFMHTYELIKKIELHAVESTQDTSQLVSLIGLLEKQAQQIILQLQEIFH